MKKGSRKEGTKGLAVVTVRKADKGTGRGTTGGARRRQTATNGGRGRERSGRLAGAGFTDEDREIHSRVVGVQGKCSKLTVWRNYSLEGLRKGG